ncbi:MAG: hypothetical protein Q8O66_01090, partial [bacterium]|nr:hypothetical protein [bacterium]
AVVFNPNRPYPPQPAVPEKIRSELVSKKMQEIPIFVSSHVNYYDGSNVMELIGEVEKSGRKPNFTRDLPRNWNPSAETMANSRSFLEYFKEQLRVAGFSRVEIPCEKCLAVIIDYSDVKVDSWMHFLARARVYYNSQEVILARDDWMMKWRPAIIINLSGGPGMVGTINKAAVRAVEDMLQTWNANIATAPRQISAVQQ